MTHHDVEITADTLEDQEAFFRSAEYQADIIQLDGAPRCPRCKGTGVSHTFTELVLTPFDDVAWEDVHEVRCDDCGGSGHVTEPRAA